MDPNADIPAIVQLSSGDRLATTMTPAQVAYSIGQDVNRHWSLMDADGAAVVVPMRHIVSITFYGLTAESLDSAMRKSVQ